MNRLICRTCRMTYSLNDPRWRCDCGSIIDIQFEARIDREKTSSRKKDMWRYREALPVDNEESIISLGEGMTPLIKATIDGKVIWLKLEQLFPTGSFKDRGSSVLVSKAKELGVGSVIEDSSGNAGSSIAAYCAAAGIKCHIFVPVKTSSAKIAQIELYGACLHRVRGSRSDTARKALAAAEGAYYASHSWNPFFFQGTKTFAYEIWEQLGFRAPDTVVIPTGNGTLLIGAYVGFQDLLELQLIKTIPRMVVVQARACAPLLEMFNNKLDGPPNLNEKSTLAEGIAVAEPVRGKQIVDIVRETGGEVIAVSEDEIENALTEMGRMGLYIEPTSASAIAGLKKYGNSPGEIIVIPLTGHGLKATDKIHKILKRTRNKEGSW